MVEEARGDVALGRRAPLAKTRVVIADRQAITRSGVRTILERISGNAVVAEATSYDATLLAVEEHGPDVLVFDLDLGDDTTRGLQLCEAITNRFPGTKILILAQSVSEFVVIDALKRGASGLLLKDHVSPDELQRAVRAVQSGETTLGTGVSKLIAKSLSSSPSETLSDRELDVIRLLAKGLGNKEIARDLFISESTVKFHVHNICKKLGCQNRTQVVHHAATAGLLG